MASNAAQPKEVEVITIDDDGPPAPNIFSIMEKQTPTTAPSWTPLDSDTIKQPPFPSPEPHMVAGEDSLVWTGPAPFEEYDADESGTSGQIGKNDKESDRKKIRARTMDRHSRVVPSNNDGKKKKRRRTLVEESDNDSDDGLLMPHIIKLRKTSGSVSEDDHDDKDEDPTILASAIPAGLLKPCAVVLEPLPRGTVQDALKRSPLATRGSPGKYEFGAKASTSNDSDSSSKEASKTMAGSVDGVLREKRSAKRRLAAPVKKRNELGNKNESGQQSAVTSIKIVAEGRESKGTEARRKENGKIRLVSDKDALDMLVGTEDHGMSSTKQLPRTGIEKGHNSGKSNAFVVPTSPSPIGQNSRIGSIAQGVDVLKRKVSSNGAGRQAPSRLVPAQPIRRVRKSSSDSKVTGEIRISASGNIGDGEIRLKGSLNFNNGTNRTMLKSPQLPHVSRGSAQVSADEAVETVLSRQSTTVEDADRQKLDDAIRKGRMQLERRHAQLAAVASSSVAHNGASRSVTSMKRIPKLSPSKKRQNTTEYASPLDQGGAISAIPAALSSARPASPAKSPFVKSLLKKLQRKKANGQQAAKNIHPTTPSTAVPSKPILKPDRTKSADEGRLVSDTGPKRSVRFVEEPQIRYIESIKSKRPNVSADAASMPQRPTQIQVTALSMTVKEEIVSAILRWNPVWFQEAKQQQEANEFQMPPISEWPLLKVQDSYLSMKSYFDTYKVLLLFATWEMVFHEYRIGLWESKENIECRVVNVTTVGDVFKDFSVVAIIEKDKIQDIHENVLLTFRLASKTPEQKREPSFLGLITRAHWSTFRRLDEVTPELRRYAKVTDENVKQFCHMKMTIRAKWKTNLPTYEIGAMIVEIMSDLSPVMRLATALASIRDSPLAPMVLNPASIAQPLPTNDHERLKIKRKASIQYRDDQLKAIAVCLNEISDIQKPVLRLISGAAGSGKSQAVVGLVEEIQLTKLQKLQDDVSTAEDRQGKHLGVVLVLASTGEKVDDLSRKLLALNKFYPPSSVGSRFIKFLRLGEKAMVADDVSRYCMGTLMEDNRRQEEEEEPAPVDENRSLITERIAHLQGQLYSFIDSQLSAEDMIHQQKIQDEIKVLEKSLASVAKGRNHRTTKVTPPEPNTATYLREYLKTAERHKRRLIAHADVIAATLNGEGADLDLFKQMCREGQIAVTCVVIDDANVAPELDTLIAAFPPVTKVFLFGEESEWSSMTASQSAYENGFGRSLFSRVLSNFENHLVPLLRLGAQSHDKY